MHFFLPEHLQKHAGSISRVLSPLMTETRRLRLEACLAGRSRQILCVFESTHHSHNISAVLRTIDAMGFLEAIFVYQNPNMRFRARDSVERGSAQWLMIKRSSSVAQTAQDLRAAGYQILLVSRPDFAFTSESFQHHLPHHTVGDPGLFDDQIMNKKQDKIALVFGSELQGIDPNWTQWAQGYLSVGMHGFVESLNVSVCAGILLHGLRQAVSKRLEHQEEILVRDYWLARATSGSRRTVLAFDQTLEEYFDHMASGRFCRMGAKSPEGSTKETTKA
jgi:tRNA (guanosine-2'-O-)-methyltransferase